MYKTKLDRWLLEHFIYEHHIKVVRLPEKIPKGVKVSEISSQQYHYLLVVKSPNKAGKLIEYLNDTGSAYNNRIVETNHWYSPLINQKSKSFTFTMFWWCILIVIGYYLWIQVRLFLASDLYVDILENLDELLGK